MANEVARSLRKRLTSQELKLWLRLRTLRRGLGIHFRRQVPLAGFIVDFACLRQRLIIEADGGQHGMPKHHRSDVERDKILSEMGYRVLRFWNTEIDENIDGVIETILTAATAPTPASEARRPSPLGRDNQD